MGDILSLDANTTKLQSFSFVDVGDMFKSNYVILPPPTNIFNRPGVAEAVL